MLRWIQPRSSGRAGLLPLGCDSASAYRSRSMRRCHRWLSLLPGRADPCRRVDGSRGRHPHPGSVQHLKQRVDLGVSGIILHLGSAPTDPPCQTGGQPSQEGEQDGEPRPSRHLTPRVDRDQPGGASRSADKYGDELCDLAPPARGPMWNGLNDVWAVRDACPGPVQVEQPPDASRAKHPSPVNQAVIHGIDQPQFTGCRLRPASHLLHHTGVRPLPVGLPRQIRLNETGVGRQPPLVLDAIRIAIGRQASRVRPSIEVIPAFGLIIHERTGIGSVVSHSAPIVAPPESRRIIERDALLRADGTRHRATGPSEPPDTSLPHQDRFWRETEKQHASERERSQRGRRGRDREAEGYCPRRGGARCFSARGEAAPEGASTVVGGLVLVRRRLGCEVPVEPEVRSPMQHRRDPHSRSPSTPQPRNTGWPSRSRSPEAPAAPTA